MTNHHYDVVVVGARVAGASTAMLLARAGLRVGLVDRAAYGTDTVSTHALMRAGVLQLSRWGVLPGVVAAGTPPVRRTVFHYADDDSVHVSIRPTPGVDALYAPRRHLLDRLLVDAAAAAGVDVRHGVSVAELLRARDGRVTGVRGVTAAGRQVTVRARLVIGADGIRSVVAEQAGAALERRATSSGYALFRYHRELDAAGYEWAYGAGCAAGMIPTNDGLTCVFVSTTRDRMRSLRKQGAETAVRTLFAEAAPDQVSRLRASVPEGPMRGWSGAPGFVRRSWGSGWALVGDAGYFKDPITAHGMTDALRDAELLANAVVSGLAGARPEKVALAAYQARRDALSRRLFEVTDKVAAYPTDLDRVRRLLREVSSAMVAEVEALESMPLAVVHDEMAEKIPPDRALVRE